MGDEPSEFDRAQQHALDCAVAVFSPKLFAALVERIPDPPYEFQDARPIEPLFDRLATLHSTEALKHLVEDEATLNELMVIAWAFHDVIQQVSGARLNRGETYFHRYKDLLDKPSPWQVCMLGMQGLKHWWRG